MKKSLILAIALLTGLSVQAQEHQYFVGLDYTNIDSKLKATTIISGVTSSMSDSDKDNNLALKFGIDNYANGRAYLKVGKAYDKGGIVYQSVSVNYDYYLTQYKVLKPFVGIGLGYGKLSWETTGISGDDKAFEYGVRIGTLINITSHTNFEIGYSYLNTNSDAKYIHPITGNSASLKGETSKGFHIGFNYKF